MLTQSIETLQLANGVTPGQDKEAGGPLYVRPGPESPSRNHRGFEPQFKNYSWP
jgi:hypothetical protein